MTQPTCRCGHMVSAWTCPNCSWNWAWQEYRYPIQKEIQMSWKYFACVGPDVDPVEASASRKPEETLAWVERAMKKAEKKFTNWQCRVYRVSADMKAEAVSRYTKPIGIDQKTEIVFHKETL